MPDSKPDVSPDNGWPDDASQARRAKRLAFSRRVYALRVIGMWLGGLPVAMVLLERQAGWPLLALLALQVIAWPTFAWMRARRAAESFRTEVGNSLGDSLIVGFWIPVIAFNLLPTVAMLMVTIGDKLVFGVRWLWLRGVVVVGATIVVVGAFTGFRMDLHSSLPVMLACLPYMVFYNLMVGLNSYHLIRATHDRNQVLERSSRLDALTGTRNRGAWEAHARQLLARAHADGTPAHLLLIDIDHFKSINDTFGHGAGDQVLREISRRLLGALREPDARSLGRYGGDEFVIALPMSESGALQVAERLRLATREVAWPGQPQQRVSISIGIAAASAAGNNSLEDWIAAADRALYLAKHAGRNRVAGPVQSAAAT